MKSKEKIFDRLSSIDSTLAAQHETLKEHIRRTELLEEAIEPIKKHISMSTGIIKFVSFLAVVATVAEAIHWMVQ